MGERKKSCHSQNVGKRVSERLSVRISLEEDDIEEHNNKEWCDSVLFMRMEAFCLELKLVLFFAEQRRNEDGRLSAIVMIIVNK